MNSKSSDKGLEGIHKGSQEDIHQGLRKSVERHSWAAHRRSAAHHTSVLQKKYSDNQQKVPHPAETSPVRKFRLDKLHLGKLDLDTQGSKTCSVPPLLDTHPPSDTLPLSDRSVALDSQKANPSKSYTPAKNLTSAQYLDETSVRKDYRSYSAQRSETHPPLDRSDWPSAALWLPAAVSSQGTRSRH